METKPSLRSRKLRIVWSVAWGIAAVLFIARWVRSYFAREGTRGVITSNFHVCVTSLRGELAIYFDRWPGNPHPWMFESNSEPSNMISVLPSITGKPPLSWFGCRWSFKPNLWAMIFPYWFLVSVCGAFVSLAWLSRSHRFSLRSLLIITTLFAVVLGLITYAA